MSQIYTTGTTNTRSGQHATRGERPLLRDTRASPPAGSSCPLGTRCRRPLARDRLPRRSASVEMQRARARKQLVGMIDTDRLTPAERALYEAPFPNGIAPNVKADPQRVAA